MTEIQLLAHVDELEILQAKCNMTEDPSPLGCYAVSVGKKTKIILLDHQDEGTINHPQLQQLLLHDMLKFSG